MKKLSAVLATVVLSASAFALPHTPEVANTLVTLNVTNVESQGKVLKRNKMHPVETITVGIPALVHFPNACTAFAGQETVNPRPLVMGLPRPGRPGVDFPIGIIAPRPQVTTIEAKGSVNPMVDACIMVAVAPQRTHFTVTFRVNNESPVAPRTLTQTVRIHGIDYVVSLNARSEEVTITGPEMPEPTEVN